MPQLLLTLIGTLVAVVAAQQWGAHQGTGPRSWGTGLNLGPAVLTAKNTHDGSSAADEWRAGMAPERARFTSYGSGGPPTPATRQFSAELAQAFDCRICQLLVTLMWEELQEPSRAFMETWLSRGCTDVVRRFLIQAGWELTEIGCDGAGVRINNTVWCMLQDPTREVMRYPDLCYAYNPAYDSLYLGCERTLGSYSRTVAAFLVSNRNGTPPGVRNEHLSNRVCREAARCGKAGPPPTEDLSCAVPTGVTHAASSAGSWIESGGKWEPICEQGYKSTVSFLHCSRGTLIPSGFVCIPDPDALSPPPIAISSYPEDGL